MSDYPTDPWGGEYVPQANVCDPHHFVWTWPINDDAHGSVGVCELCGAVTTAEHDARLLAAIRALVGDWQANGNSRELGDPTASTWQEAAWQLLTVLEATTADHDHDPTSEGERA